MAKKATVSDAEQAQKAAPLPEEHAQDEMIFQSVPEDEAAESEPGQEVPEDAEPEEDEADPVCYRVSCPGGVHLRAGPGRAYRSLAVLPAGARVLTDDAVEMLRADRCPSDSAWMMVLSREGSGWVDGAYLERLDEPAE